jgi:DNA-binding CsgD family transcriptional regulator
MEFVDAFIVHGEVQAMLALVRGGESIEAVRTLIGTNTPTRRAIRQRFDELVNSEAKPAESYSQGLSPKETKSRQTPKRLSDEESRQATEMMKTGKTWSQVAKHFGVSRATVRKYVSWRRVAKPDLTDEQKTFVKRELLKGRTAYEIARTHDLSQERVYRLRAEMRKESYGQRPRTPRAETRSGHRATA